MFPGTYVPYVPLHLGKELCAKNYAKRNIVDKTWMKKLLRNAFKEASLVLMLFETEN